MRCRSCETDNPASHRFCSACGVALTSACQGCGSSLAPNARFCGSCGAAVGTGHLSSDAPVPAPRRPEAQRRLVSVLFVDLVGFTTFAEGRDPEAVRDVQSAYFERAREVVARHGGRVEKFIGDAVMAVWGTPLAREDDAERAVRAALELVDRGAIAASLTAWPQAAARAGVVTGEVAVRLAAVDQGMVAGDVVNTAARVQSVAEPGSVLVDETTRALSSLRVAYRSAGEHQLKGRAEPAALSTAIGVIDGADEGSRDDVLETVFVGREPEQRALEELFDQTIEQSRARLVVISGEAGVGKSRLVSELFRHLDAREEVVLWHVGRGRSYTDDVAYRAVADMVRMRLRVNRDDEEERILARLDDVLVDLVTDTQERAWIRPRLMALLGVGDATDARVEELERDTLFAGWRRFFELLSERHPVVLVFDDVAPNDTAQLDLVDHLLEWSAARPMLLIVLARPELLEARPGWSGPQNALVALHLAPLPIPTIERFLDALVAGLPEATRQALAARSEGMPLFARETVRMLIDRELVVPRDGAYVLASEGLDVDGLEVPDTLRALVAARLDALPPEEAQLVADASVLGVSFSLESLTALIDEVGSIDPTRLDTLLRALTRREVLNISADPRSPDAGRYRFVQQLLRTVAYERLSRRDRKDRHLAAATHLSSSDEVGDLAGATAAHYLDAATAVPDDPEASELRARAVAHLERAGERARSLAALDEARRLYVRAFDLAEVPAVQARLAEAAGLIAHRQSQPAVALDHLDDARQLLGVDAPADRLVELACHRADALIELDRVEEALEELTSIEARYAAATGDLATARLALQIARATTFLNEYDTALSWSDRACAAAERAGDPDALSSSLNARAAILDDLGRPVESLALFKGALDLAIEHDRSYRAVFPACNLAQVLAKSDLEVAESYARQGAEHAHRVGAHNMLASAVTTLIEVQLLRGAWSEIDEPALRALLHRRHGGWLWWPLTVLATLSLWRGTPAQLDRWLDDPPPSDASADVSRREVRALLALQAGEFDEAFALGDGLVEDWQARVALGLFNGWPTLTSAALDVGRLEVAERFLDGVAAGPEALTEPLDTALHDWMRARLADAAGDHEEARRQRSAAIEDLRAIGAVWWLSQALLDAAEQAHRQGRSDVRELATEARDLLAAMGAAPSLRRMHALLAELGPGATA